MLNKVRIRLSKDMSPINRSGSIEEEEEEDDDNHKHVVLDPSYAVNKIKFVLHGTSAQYIIVPKSVEDDVSSFIENVFFKGSFLPRKPPGAIISITGGAQYYEVHSLKLLRLFNRGLIKAAQNIGAWIVDGGMDAGVMHYVGKAISHMSIKDIPCIGVATRKMVMLNDRLSDQQVEGEIDYQPMEANSGKHCALDPNHSHFILVDSPLSKWGQETRFVSLLQSEIRTKYSIPVVLVVINGGPVTLELVAEGVEMEFHAVVVEGTGRVSDAIVEFIKLAKKNTSRVYTCHELAAMSTTDELSAWNKLCKENQASSDMEGAMNKILAHMEYVTVFNPNDDEESDMSMDIVILRTIIHSRKLTMLKKLEYGVIWDRADIVQEIIDDEKSYSTEDTKQALNHALQLSLTLDRPKIFTLLKEKGAQVECLLADLYQHTRVQDQMFRGHVRSLRKLRYLPDRLLSTYVLNIRASVDIKKSVNAGNGSAVKNILAQAGRSFRGYASTMVLHDSMKQYQGEDQNTDLLVWAVFTNMMELAKAIWLKTSLPVHCALLACNLYRFLAKMAVQKQEYIDNSNWFENEAIKIMTLLDSRQASSLLQFKWHKIGLNNLLDLAEDAKCKKFMSHPHVQSLLDKILYSYRKGSVAVYESAIRLCIKRSGIQNDLFSINPRVYFQIPIVKFWNNTIFYCLFLILQAHVLVTMKSLDIIMTEYFLWVYVVSYAFSEIMQASKKDSSGYFSHFSNKIDIIVITLHIVYIALRWSSTIMRSNGQMLGATNVLIIACLFSWLRLTAIFPVSSTLGPLYFIMVKLFRDCFLWIFICLIFAISFQLGFVSLTLQAGGDPLQAYPGGSFPVSFFAMLGEFGEVLPMMSETPIGVALVGVYTLIAQVILVNLLIAMMGDTYTTMKQNSDEEWKFYRRLFVRENVTVSCNPPPTNLILSPIQALMGRSQFLASQSHSRAGTVIYEDLLPRTDNLQKLMRATIDKIVEQGEMEEINSFVSITKDLKERIQGIYVDRDNDRAFMEKKLIAMESLIEKTAKNVQDTNATLAKILSLMQQQANP